MTSTWEIAANALNAISIFLAGRNRVPTWWTGILGCLLFGYVFFVAKLYADLTLQLFFIATSAIGWWNWQRGESGRVLPVRRSSSRLLVLCTVFAVLAALGYGALLH